MHGKIQCPVSVNMRQTNEVHGSTARSVAHKTNSLIMKIRITRITTVHLLNKKTMMMMVTQSMIPQTSNIAIVKKKTNILIVTLVGGARRNTNTHAMKSTNMQIVTLVKQNKLEYAELVYTSIAPMTVNNYETQ